MTPPIFFQYTSSKCYKGDQPITLIIFLYVITFNSLKKANSQEKNKRRNGKASIPRFKELNMLLMELYSIYIYLFFY